MGSGDANNWRSLKEALWEFTPRDLQIKYKDALEAWRRAGSPSRFVRYSSATASRDFAQQHGRKLFHDKKVHGKNLQEALRKDLVSGALRAEGCPGSPNAQRVPIRADAWRLARFRSWEYSTIALPGEPSLFFNVRISLAPEKAADRQCIARADAETACREWLIALMGANPEQRPKPKAHYQRDALSRFEGLSIRSFHRAWDAAIEITGSQWNLAGRPKKSPQAKSKRQ
ncbi:hypothetical protein FHS83_000926 [Rhizomicrobium palustre]|uniref:Uncharacterized protein n=1 Tax=Rhizomicrobium palustre TaxID=189966 RepID=A0A846MVM7_9PROT|nr:hypothetical protein [Rhizomicrobium palustre]